MADNRCSSKEIGLKMEVYGKILIDYKLEVIVKFRANAFFVLRYS